MKKLDERDAQTIIARIAEFPSRHKLRPYDVIARAAETFSNAQRRGCDIDDLMPVLRDMGITLARNTVRNYLSRALSEQRRMTTPADAQHERVALAPAEERENVTKSSAPPPPSTAAATTPQPPVSADHTPQQTPAGKGAASDPAPGPTPTPSANQQSVLERARMRALESKPTHDLPTPGSFRIRPDTQDL
jgi:hypothetical protein